MHVGLKVAALAMIATAGAATGQQPGSAGQRPLVPLFACLAQQADTVRLSCLETEARRLQAAERSRDVVVMDRQQATILRQAAAVDRGGQSGRRAVRPPFTLIDTALTAANMSGGKWVFETRNDGVWTQADVAELGRTPRAGDRWRVRRGAVGGFLANIGDGPAIRVRRLR